VREREKIGNLLSWKEWLPASPNGISVAKTLAGAESRGYWHKKAKGRRAIGGKSRKTVEKKGAGVRKMMMWKRQPEERGETRSKRRRKQKNAKALQ